MLAVEEGEQEKERKKKKKWKKWEREYLPTFPVTTNGQFCLQ